MTWLVTIGLTNAVLAALLGLFAWLVGRWAKRPALTHVLWVLALIKLLTPPVFEVPIGWRIDPAVFDEPAQPSASIAAALPAASISVFPVAAPPNVPAAPAAARLVTVKQPLPSATPSAPALAPEVAAALAWASSPANWLRAALAIWLAGSIALAALYWSRMRRFRKYLKLAARTDDELSDRLVELANKARLTGSPRVVTVESTISPMLFGLGRSVVLIFPAALSRQLAPAARDTLLLHELAHYARGDHWVRLVELLAQVVFWWHPVVWWARRELETAEEECCDAWVVQRQAGVPRLYAEALLATIDFLCAEALPLPPAACGLGDVPFLRARLKQIVKGRLAAQLSPAAKTAVFLAAVFVLPLGPALFGAAPATDNENMIASADIAPAIQIVNQPSLSAPDSPTPASVTPAVFDPSPTVAAIAALVRPPRAAQLWATAISPDGLYRLEARTGFQVTLFRLRDNTRLSFATEPFVKCASFSPNGRFVTGHDNSQVAVYDSLGGFIKPLSGASAAIQSVAYSPDGTRVAAGAADGSVTVWDVTIGEPSTLISPRGAPVSCLRWSPDSQRLAVALGDLREQELATLVICDAADGRVEEQYALNQPAGALQWLAGGQALLISDWEGSAAVWRVSDGLVLAPVTLDKNSVSAANWSPDCALELPPAVQQLLEQAAP